MALGFVGNIVGWAVGGSVGEGIGRQFSVGSLPDGGGYVAARFEFGNPRPNGRAHTDKVDVEFGDLF